MIDMDIIIKALVLYFIAFAESRHWGRLGLWIRSVALVFLILLDPFKITTATDNASADILNRVNALYYSSKGQDEIVVVLINDDYLNNNGLSWPLSYVQQAGLFKRILSYEPKGLFVDLLYTHDRSARGDSPEPLANIFDRYSSRVPIYLPRVNNSALSGSNFFSSTDPVIVQWDGYDSYYPSQIDSLSTPAFALYSQYCNGDSLCSLPETPPPIALQWGMELSSAQYSLTNNASCMSEQHTLTTMSQILLSEVFWKFVPEWRQRCAYSTTLPPDYLSATKSEDKKILKDLLKDKFVMVGALIQGARDEVYSPVHGKVAGVYFHAMALDNLITYKEHYFRPAPTVLGNIDLADITDCLLFLLVFMWREKVAERQSENKNIGASDKRFIAVSAIILIVLLLAVVIVFSYLLNFEPINWVAQLTLILSIFAVKIRLFTPLKTSITYLKGLTKEKIV